jgi:hypothetical protein
MWIRKLFDFLKPARSRTPVRPTRGRLSVEALGDRIVPAAMFSTWGTAILEGNTGTHQAVVTVTLSDAHPNGVSVNYSTADGTAIAGSDYKAVSGTLTFAKRETSKTILVPVIGDRLPEPDETFFVNLTNARGATIANGTSVVTIQDDEPRINILDVYNQGETSFTFTVSLTTVYDQAVTVNFATADGTMIAGVDYVAASGTLTFAPGVTTQTITINALNPASTDTYFEVHLSGASSNALITNQVAYGFSNYSFYGYDEYGGYGGYYGGAYAAY